MTKNMDETMNEEEQKDFTKRLQAFTAEHEALKRKYKIAEVTIPGLTQDGRITAQLMRGCAIRLERQQKKIQESKIATPE